LGFSSVVDVDVDAAVVATGAVAPIGMNEVLGAVGAASVGLPDPPNTALTMA
jgi:hypothetical protein